MVEHSKADRNNAILLFYWIVLLKEVGTNYYKEELRTLMRGTSKNIANTSDGIKLALVQLIGRGYWNVRFFRG